MLRNIPIVLAAASRFGAAPLPADSRFARQAVDFPRLSKPLKRTSDLVPRLVSSSFDFALRLFLYWGMTHVLRKMQRNREMVQQPKGLRIDPAR
jgi:hypothetical protein